MSEDRTQRRRRSFGNVRPQSGRHQARYTGPDGRKHAKTFGTKAEALRWLNDVEHSLNHNTYMDPAAPAVRLQDFAADWLRDRPLAATTRDLYGDLLRLFIIPAFGRTPIGGLTAADVRKWHHELASKTGARRQSAAYSLLRTIMGTAVSDKLITHNPCNIRGAGSHKGPERGYMSIKDAYALADAMPTSHMRTLVVVTLWAHLRRGELLALRWEDVNLDARTVRVHRAIARTKAGPVEKTTKSDEERLLKLPPAAIAELRRLLAETGPVNQSDNVFRHISGRPLQRQHIAVAWKRAREKTGLNFRFHDLRAAGLTAVAETGATLKEIMGRGGHSSPRAALLYQRRALPRDEEIADELEIMARHATSQPPNEGPARA